MERSQNRNDEPSGSSTFPEEAKEVLQASLLLSILKHTGDHVSKGDDNAQSTDTSRASSSRAPVRKPCAPDPSHVPRVKALIDSIGPCLGWFEKQVTKSDISDQQNRLILKKDHVEEFVLPLLRTGDLPVKDMVVKTFSTQGKTYPMRFKRWCEKVYVLTSDWKLFVKENQLRVSDVLTIWAFRDVRTQGLCFLIACRRPKSLELSRPERDLEATEKGKERSAAS